MTATGTDKLLDHLALLVDARVALVHDNYDGSRWWVEVDGAQVTAVGPTGATSAREALSRAFEYAVAKLFDRPPDEPTDD